MTLKDLLIDIVLTVILVFTAYDLGQSLYLIYN